MRDIPVGNGSLLVTFDDKYQIRDVYFPHVGQENHTEGFPFRFGVWADGEFSWISEDDWKRELHYLARNARHRRSFNQRKARLGNRFATIRWRATKIFFCGRVRVSNLRDKPREVRVFLHHDFRISENKVGDTAFYDPETLRARFITKSDRYFLINTEPHFDAFATGQKGFRRPGRNVARRRRRRA